MGQCHRQGFSLSEWRGLPQKWCSQHVHSACVWHAGLCMFSYDPSVCRRSFHSSIVFNQTTMKMPHVFLQEPPMPVCSSGMPHQNVLPCFLCEPARGIFIRTAHEPPIISGRRNKTGEYPFSFEPPMSRRRHKHTS